MLFWKAAKDYQRSTRLCQDKHDHCYATQVKLLTEHYSEEGWSGAGRQVDANVVDWYAGQRHSNSHQRVDGVAVEGNHYQEYAAQAVDDRKEQRQLRGRERGKAEEDNKGKAEKEERRRKVERLKLEIITLTNIISLNHIPLMI